MAVGVRAVLDSGRHVDADAGVGGRAAGKRLGVWDGDACAVDEL